MAISFFDYLYGTLSIVTVAFSILVGISIASKYFKYKDNKLLLVGFCNLGLYQPWWGSAVAFIMVLLTGSGIPTTLYFFVGNFFIPIFIVPWMYVMSEFLSLKRKWILPLIYTIIGVIMSSYVLFYLITDYTILGTINGFFDAEYSGIMMAYLIFTLVSIVITGIFFARKSLKAETKEIKLKGKFLIIAFLFYLGGGLFDAGATLSTMVLIISRTVLIIGSMLFYIGWLMPEKIKKIFDI